MRPERIGPYRIVETVAEDAFTVTFRAEDPGLGRTLRLKTARASPPLLGVRERLMREAKIVAPLSGPGLLRLHGLVRREDGVFLLFEDAEGPLLSALLEKTPRPLVARALAIGCQVASALAHLHARGLVFAGLTPSRVGLSPSGTVRLVDFSTVHAAGQADEEGEPLRPVEHLAPEQILGESATSRTDVFSLGILLFQLLTGKLPWAPPASPARSPDVLAPAPPPEPRHALLHRIRSSPPPAIETVEGEASALIQRIVWRCLAKDPADRYPDAGDVVVELSDALRELSAEPAETLVIRALAAANFVPDLPPKAARLPAEKIPERDVLRRLAGQLAVIFGLIVLGAIVTEQASVGMRPAPPPSETPPGARGYVRVLAQPWADISIDGERIDTTPIARPIAVAPGRHFVTFSHPNAPEEKRSIDVAAGQTVLLDVSLRIERKERDAGAEAGPADDSP